MSLSFATRSMLPAPAAVHPSAHALQQQLDPADLAACRALLADGSRTFHAASFLLPAAVRAPACALYAFCRLADDAVDCSSTPAQALQGLQARVEAIYEGRPQALPSDRALAAVVSRHGIPAALPLALLDGLAWDVEGRRYDSLDALEDYAARVAGSVGAMMALLMGVRSAQALARATDLGVAMQLSNIARDVGEDARMGRIYLPGAWMREAGLQPDAWLRQPVHTPALGQVVRRLLDRADELYRQVDEGLALLPANCRPGINAARWLYAEIGREVDRRGLDAVSQRAVVAPGRKAGLLVRALAGARMGDAGRWADASNSRVLPANRFLVQAVQDHAWHPGHAAQQDAGWGGCGAEDGLPWWRLDERWVRALVMFDEVERRQRGFERPLA